MHRLTISKDFDKLIFEIKYYWMYSLNFILFNKNKYVYAVPLKLNIETKIPKLSTNFTICGLVTKIENRREFSGWHGYTKESDSTEANNGKSKSVSPLTHSGMEVCVSGGLLVEGRSFSIGREKSDIPARETAASDPWTSVRSSTVKVFFRESCAKRDKSSLWKLARTDRHWSLVIWFLNSRGDRKL